MLDKIKDIETKGYCIIPQVYSPQEVAKLLNLCVTWYEKTESETSADVPFLNKGQPNIYNLQNKDYYFIESLLKPKELQSILQHFLNDVWYKQIPADKPNYIMRACGARSSNTGLPLHIDSFVPYVGDNVIAMQFGVVLEDQNINNGCTIVVPASHQSGKYASKDALKDAIPVEPKAGDVVMWDSRLWHGTTDNTSGKTRWAIIATFTRWWVKQQFNLTDNLPQEIYEKLTPEQKSILGFCSIPYNTEFEGIDLKRGYDSLLQNVSDYKK